MFAPNTASVPLTGCGWVESQRPKVGAKWCQMVLQAFETSRTGPVGTPAGD